MATQDMPIRRFKEPPPVDYDDVPAVLKWLVRAILHLDNCFDSRLASIEGNTHDSTVRTKFLKQQAAIVAASVSFGGGVAYLAHALNLI